MPPIGWEAAQPYLVLPVLLVLFQYVSSAAIAPPPDPNQARTRLPAPAEAGTSLSVVNFQAAAPRLHRQAPAVRHLPGTCLSAADVWPMPAQDESSKRTTQALNAFLPLLVGYFSINLPSGVGLYYFANILVTSGQQVYLRKLGGAAPCRRLRSLRREQPGCAVDAGLPCCWAHAHTLWQ